MRDRLASLKRAYDERPKEKADLSLWQFVAERDPWLFSHHPAAPEFRAHVWKIGGLYFCKGCVMTFAGGIFGLLFYWLTGWLRAFSIFEIAVIFVLMLLPTLFTSLLRLPRTLKHVARFFLGLLVVSAFLMLFVTDFWWVRGTIVACYFGAKMPLERKRNRENQRELEERA